MELLRDKSAEDYMNFRMRNMEFYYVFRNDKPSYLAKTTSMKAYQYKKGALKTSIFDTYVAPIDGKPFIEGNGSIKNLRINRWHDYYSYIDEGNRFNISIDEEYFSDGILDLSTDGFVNLTKTLAGKEPFNRIRMMTCHSANGGTESIAAKVAERTGMPTSGYRGQVITTDTQAISKAQMAMDGAIKQSTVGTRNFLKQSADGSFRPTALEKEFHPSFGSPGFDDMGSFLDGVFI